MSEQSQDTSPTEARPYTGAFFPNSRHIVVAGGTFTSNNTIVTTAPTDFLRLPLGSIDLQNEIRLDAAGVVSWQRSRGPVRRMYSAQVECRNKPMTVALYQGDHAEEEWRKDLSRHSPLRHPFILQIYAIASSSGIHATVFHDDILPFQQFLESFQHSAILQAYIVLYTDADSHAAYTYYSGILATSGLFSIWWIRPSTSRLSVELSTQVLAVRGRLLRGTQEVAPPHGNLNPRDPTQEFLAISCLGHCQWYSVCSTYFRHRQRTRISLQAEVQMASIIFWPSDRQFEDTTEIAVSPDSHITCMGWISSKLGPLQGSSPRCNAADVFESQISLMKYNDLQCATWLSQANYIFKQRQIASNYENYVLVGNVHFYIQISAPERNPPAGYLFLCSPTDFETESTSLRWPDRPAYWSLDPSGKSPLSVEAASGLGFPPIGLGTEIDEEFWDETVYSGLRKFDAGKGFDPETQDAARYLGFPLLEVVLLDPEVLEQNWTLDQEHECDNELVQEFTAQDDVSSLHY
ncbi:hypothetical protein C8R45DRAFT_1011528 [Mycena sanguinolenta]|nr:hypothetical protein C8R45DRAFT_1011528 [Mycena sanguinolenta]